MSKLKEIYQALVDRKAIVGKDTEDQAVALQLDEEGHLHYLKYYLEEIHDDGDYIEPEGWYDITQHEDPHQFIIKDIDESGEAPFYEMEISIVDQLRSLALKDTSCGCLMAFGELLKNLLSGAIVIITQENKEFLTFELGEDDHIKILCFHYDEDLDDNLELDYHKIDWWIDLDDQFSLTMGSLSIIVVDKSTVPTEQALLDHIRTIPLL